MQGATTPPSPVPIDSTKILTMNCPNSHKILPGHTVYQSDFTDFKPHELAPADLRNL